MDTLILSWYDGGYESDIRFFKIPKKLQESEKNKIVSWCETIKNLYDEYLTKDFVKAVFGLFIFINTIIICEDGGIEIYTRKEGLV